MKYLADCEGETFEVELVEDDGRFYVVRGGERLPVELLDGGAPIRRIRIGESEWVFGARENGDRFHVLLGGIDYSVRVQDARVAALSSVRPAGTGTGGHGEVRAPIPGRVVRLLAETGSRVERNQPVAVLDAMKLENEIVAPAGGRVTEVLVEIGRAVEKGQVLMRIEP
ncbi:MAG: biotin/lipoyl-binding protein [Planctomycetes bacterium]|nr:biotin/lipoyl-binding protein [Planctomycetota bacterium]